MNCKNGMTHCNYRTPCKYPGKHIAFRVNEGSTDYWLALLVEFEDGDGDVGSMHIREVCTIVALSLSLSPPSNPPSSDSLPLFTIDRS